MDPVYVLKKPLLTEKSTAAQEHANVYHFEVDRRATKVVIKEAVEKAFGVTVVKVNTTTLKGLTRRTRFGYVQDSKTKKAMVRLKDGDAIELI
ncbi:MAG: 50S ribosomal protein L23 [Phycisphaeraceae bacterium]|nr:MAG: 50S ribosomal protein L23 [Phycisphaeraceae bacterium]